MIISLREHLRIHKASVRRIIQGVGDKTEATDPEARKLGRALRVRLDDTFQLLEYYDVTASSLLDQQQNLLSLVFIHLFSMLQKILTQYEGFQHRDSISGTSCYPTECSSFHISPPKLFCCKSI